LPTRSNRSGCPIAEALVAAVVIFAARLLLERGDPARGQGHPRRLRGSSDRVCGRWWHAVRALGFFWLLSIAAGPVLGFTLVFTNFSLLWINVIGSVVFALLVPYVALGRTLLYFDLGVRAEEEPAKPWREQQPRRAATAEA
jgi:hypothetical protein